AMSVPITMLTRVTRNAWTTVRRIAAAVCGLVIVFQNSVQPPLAVSATTAASGIRASTLNHSTVTPRPMADAGRSRRRPSDECRRDRRARRAVGTVVATWARASSTTVMSGLPRGLLGLGHDAVILVEELLGRLRPPAEV